MCASTKVSAQQQGKLVACGGASKEARALVAHEQCESGTALPKPLTLNPEPQVAHERCESGHRAARTQKKKGSCPQAASAIVRLQSIPLKHHAHARLHAVCLHALCACTLCACTLCACTLCAHMCACTPCASTRRHTRAPSPRARAPARRAPSSTTVYHTACAWSTTQRAPGTLWRTEYTACAYTCPGPTTQACAGTPRA